MARRNQLKLILCWNRPIIEIGALDGFELINVSISLVPVVHTWCQIKSYLTFLPGMGKKEKENGKTVFLPIPDFYCLELFIIFTYQLRWAPTNAQVKKVWIRMARRVKFMMLVRQRGLRMPARLMGPLIKNINCTRNTKPPSNTCWRLYSCFFIIFSLFCRK